SRINFESMPCAMRAFMRGRRARWDRCSNSFSASLRTKTALPRQKAMSPKKTHCANASSSDLAIVLGVWIQGVVSSSSAAAAEWRPDLQLPPIRDDDRRHVIQQLCLGAMGYKDIKDRDAKPIVQSWLSYEQRHVLDKHAPERVTLTNGRTPKVTYVADGPPYV